ncbi:SH3 domain-containing protein [Novosphingobium album (ex Liu et al. 2023)]
MKCMSLLPGIVALIVLAAPAHAEDGDVPYWASISADIAYMRVGPSNTYRIDWVYKRRNLPVKVVRREGPWRFVVDPDGTKGWIRDLLLSRERMAIVTGGGLAEMHARGSTGSPLLWRLEPGVIGKLGECESGWCEFNVDGHKGFAPQERLWGSAEP